MSNKTVGSREPAVEPKKVGSCITGVERVGVVGCGQMGVGIACLCAKSGYQTLVSEVNEEMLRKGMGAVYAKVAMAVRKGRMLKRDEDAIRERLKGTTEIGAFSECDLVIEAVTEKLDEKKKVFASLDRVCPPHAILASDTSSLSVTEIAMATDRPEQVIGLHFCRPVTVMTLLEIVTTSLCSESTVIKAKDFGESLGKSVVFSRDEPGYIVSRLMVPFILDAMRLLESGGATREHIDTSLVLGCNHPMGPLRLADFIGLDTVYYIADALYDEYKDRRFTPPLSLKRMVAAGHMGRKTGKGFYEYD